MVGSTCFGSPNPSWLDTEGASLIGTLRKAWGDEAPRHLGGFLLELLERGQRLGLESPAAAESCALGVAHLLPVLLRYSPLYLHCLLVAMTGSTIIGRWQAETHIHRSRLLGLHT